MSITTSEHDDLNDTQEYTIAGLVILLFGFLYLLFNYGLPSFSFNSASSPTPLPVLEDQAPSTAGGKLASKQVALSDADTEAASTGNNQKNGTVQNSVKSTQEPETDHANKQQLAAATADGKSPVDQQIVTTEQPVTPDQQNLVENASDTSQSESVITEEKTEKTDEPQEAGGKSANGSLIIMDVAVSKLHDHLLNNRLDEPVVMDSINFANKSNQIELASDHQIKGIAGLLERYPDTKILIRGHSSDEGSTSANKTLSLDRATAAGEKLVEAGAQAGNIILMGMGNTEPLAGNNPRIDISITQSRPTVDRPKE